jgi:hypothetical protein
MLSCRADPLVRKRPPGRVRPGCCSLSWYYTSKSSHAGKILGPRWNRLLGMFVFGAASFVLVGPTPPSARDPWSRFRLLG